MSAMKYFEIKMKKSGVGQPYMQRRILAGIGIRRFGQIVYLRDIPSVRGMLYKISHLIEVIPHTGDMPLSSRMKRKQKQKAEHETA